MNKREIQFVNTFFNGREYRKAKSFKLNRDGMVRYTPDVYDVERDTYIEIVGSRQAYHANKEKYKMFRQCYPNIKFEIRHYTGQLHSDQLHSEFDKSKKISELVVLSESDLQEIFKLLREFAGTHKAAAKHIGMSYTRYNEWRYRPQDIPPAGCRLLELAAKEIQANNV